MQLDKYIEQARSHHEKNPGMGTMRNAVKATIIKGEPASVVDIVAPILKRDPKNIRALEHIAEAYLHQEKYDLAEKTINKIILIKPDIEPYISKYLEAISYLKSSINPKANLSNFTGAFRSDHNEMTFQLNLIGNHLHFKAEYQNGNFMFPSGVNTIQRGHITRGYQQDFLLNDQNKVFAQKRTETIGNIVKTLYDWKQDSTILKAEKLLKETQYEEAYKAYNTAIEAHPKHYYLKKHLEHLEYLQSRAKEEVQKNLQRFSGDYKEAKFWIENELFYYKIPGNVRRILRPISENRFITLSEYHLMYEFVEENNKIVGVRSYLHDFETDEWQLNPDWYYERKDFLD